MATISKQIILGVALLISAWGAAYVWKYLSGPPRWERGYGQIAVGDSESKVLAIMGEPSERTDCRRENFSGNVELWAKCGEELSYNGFMQKWGCVIGKDGTLIAKWHNVSP